jgi:Skp family chaperone for outer membrane proteins
MEVVDDFRRREGIIKEVAANLENLEKELKSEIKKIKNPETKLRGQQLDYYLLQIWTVFNEYNAEIKDHVAKIDKLMQELVEAGIKTLKERGFRMLPRAKS